MTAPSDSPAVRTAAEHLALARLAIRRAFDCTTPAAMFEALGDAISHVNDADLASHRPAAPRDGTDADEPADAEQEKNIQMHHTLALIHGFNEMVTKATTLGEKTYYRLARDMAEKRFNELGGQINRVDERAPVLVIPGHVPEIRFDERDIDLMRECVARYDAAPTGTSTPPLWTEEDQRRTDERANEIGQLFELAALRKVAEAARVIVRGYPSYPAWGAAEHALHDALAALDALPREGET